LFNKRTFPTKNLGKMAKNREMLKEAIAEAKAVKEMAIANAKAALEEAFTPQLKSMLSLKLQEMEEEDLDEVGFGKAGAESEEGFSSMGEKALDEEKEEMMEVDLEELLAELENEEMDESLNEAEEEEGEEEEEGGEEGEPLDLEDMTDEDLKKMIEDVISDMVASGELEAGHEEGEGEEEGEETEMSDEEEVDLAELLREIEEMEEKEMYEEKEEMTEEKEEVEEGLGDFFKNLLKGSEQKWLEKNYPDWENIDSKDEAKVKEIVSKFQAEMKAGGVQPEYLRAMNSELLRLLGRGSGVRGVGAGLTVAREGQEKELEEAYSTIESLKAELNEINLLNAKLLYTNKIFKSKNLNENQKVKVLSSFDKAKNVGEVKMVFETLNEGIKVKKETIKENLGRASKSTITPTAKQPIVESNDVFARMQKLAGII
jgi:hypothetical protein